MQRRTRIKRRVITFRRRNSFGPRLQLRGEQYHVETYGYRQKFVAQLKADVISEKKRIYG